MVELYLLPAHDWLCSLTVATAVLSSPDREVYFFDADQQEAEAEALALLSGRLPLKAFNLTGADWVSKLLVDLSIECRPDPFAGENLDQSLVKIFGAPKGFCAASADSPSDCLKAAALAVRLGYNFVAWNMDHKALRPGTDFKDRELIWVGSGEPGQAHAALGDNDSWKVVASDSQYLDCLYDAGLKADYLVVCNSADLGSKTSRGRALGELWTSGLSLHLLTLASYRPVFPFDAGSINPDPRLIEEHLQLMVNRIGLKPRFQVVLASPAAVPFFFEEKKAIGPVTEEMVRDIHLRLNDDPFFDLAEGRLMQNTSGGLSAQLISTKRFDEVKSNLGRSGRDLLIVSTPHVETGIIFSTDDALIDTQLVSLFEDAGYNINQLRAQDASNKTIADALAGSDYFLYTGHGGPEGLHTHGRSLDRSDLPLLPPLVAYASACSTVGLVPYWYSPDEGITWEGVPVDARQVIGLSFVEKGAICFIGGATIEDLQYTTSTYSVFMEALLLKGMSVGEAVLEIRHVICLYALTLLQKSPEAYRKYRWGTANAIHQQVLLGDPAFVPSPGRYTEAAIPHVLSGSAPLEKLTVEIPEERWQRGEAAVHKMDASKYYYRCRNVGIITPYGMDIFSWGDYYRVAPDARNISEWAVKSTFLHLTHDLPPGMAPQSLVLVDAEAGEGECLLCGEEAGLLITPLEAMRRFKLPYLLQPPIELNMEEGWAFSCEQRDGYIRMRWLVPLLLIDENQRQATPIKSFTFKIESAPSKLIKGQIVNPEPGAEYLVCAGFDPGSKAQGDSGLNPFQITAAALTTAGGSFALGSAPGALIRIEEQFPLYTLLEPYRSFKRELYRPAAGEEMVLELQPAEMIVFGGYIYDSLSGVALPGALVRVFRGEYDPVGDALIEAYAGETRCGDRGEFSLALSAGNYLVYAVMPSSDRLYKSAEWALRLRPGERGRRVFRLDQAGLVRGRVSFEGYQLPEPASIALKRFPKVEGEAALTKVPAGRDGSFACRVSFQDRFQVVLEEEGYQYIYDDNEGRGYLLEPQQVLERDYRLIFNQEQQTQEEDPLG